MIWGTHSACTTSTPVSSDQSAILDDRGGAESYGDDLGDGSTPLGGMSMTASYVGEESPPIGYAPAEYCGSCHENHYRDWQGSMHAYATRDPIFQAMNAKGIAETEGRLDQFCVQCHAPVASLKDRLPVTEVNGVHVQNLDMDDVFVRDGIQCVTCHSIESVQATQNAQVTLSETQYFGATGSDAANEVHPIQASPLFTEPNQKSLLCGSCHDVLNPNNARLEATFSEWYSNEFNQPQNPEKHKTCQDCHMPSYRGKITKNGPEKELHAHTFVGVDQALITDFPQRELQAQWVKELLTNCALLDVSYNGVNEVNNAVVVIGVTNINNGHNLPSGSTADRQMWVHLTVVDEAGRLVYESGMLDENGDLMDGVEGHSSHPEGDPELLLFGQFIFGENGEHVNFPWQAFTYADHLIAPGQRAWRDYEIPARNLSGQRLTVKATLNYRTFPPFLIRSLIEEGWLDSTQLLPIPIVEMEVVEREILLP